MSKKIKVAILGAGPVGAYVYAACKDFGADIEVFSKVKTGAPQGAFWLRWIPFSIVPRTIKAQRITVKSLGTRENYIKKQWGTLEQNNGIEYVSSFPAKPKYESGFNPEEVLPYFWLGCNLNYVNELDDEYVAYISKNYDLIFQTFPTKKSLLINAGKMVRVPTIKLDPYDGSFYHILKTTNPKFSLDNEVIYDGRSNTNIVRISTLFGSVYFEFVFGTQVPEDLMKFGTVGSFNDLHPSVIPWDSEDVPAENVYLVGRYAEWKRDMLSHDSYKKVSQLLVSYQKGMQEIHNAKGNV